MWEMKKTLVLEIYLIEGGVFIALERSSFPSPDHLILRCIGCCSWSFCYLNFSIKELFLCDVLWISPGVVLGLLVRICIDKPKLFLIKKYWASKVGILKKSRLLQKIKLLQAANIRWLTFTNCLILVFFMGRHFWK